ncbi:hypothetical protein [Clostridium estertheticum]|uniref:hypothetical protein n=1 Tax=Clostridium estertheticum TaxID=238834 RepID=UPI001C0D8D29|nr:hypothetical protein [Clostridium estertheticum]MBU3186561.1 hypothetical protein [Clostridium estertheticum]
MKKLLKGLWRNCYFIISTIFLVTAAFKGETFSSLVYAIGGIGCLILQMGCDSNDRLDKIQSKLDAMEMEYLEHELINGKVSLNLTKAIFKYTGKEEK